MRVEDPPLFSPCFDFLVTAALSVKTPVRIIVYHLSSWLQVGVCSAHETLAQVIEAVGHVRSSVDVEVKVLVIGRSGVICSTD